MPAGIPNSSLPDLINHALPDFKDRGLFQVAFDNQNYSFEDFIREGVYRVQNGNGVEWRAVLVKNGSFRFVNKAEVTPRGLISHFIKGRAEWCYAECKATYERRTMDEMNGEAEIVDYINGEFFTALIDACDGIESAIWGVPGDSGDTKTPTGVPFTICMCGSGTTDASGGFNGQTAIYGDATTTTTIHQIPRATTPKARNWCATYGSFGLTALDTIARGMVFTGFKPPRDVKSYITWKTPKKIIYSSLTNALEYERLTNLTADNKNGDLRRFNFAEAPQDYRGIEWRGIAALESKTYSPIFLVDLSHQFMFIKNGWWMRKTDPMNDVDQPHVYTVQYDFQFNCANENPRTSAVFHTPR